MGCLFPKPVTEDENLRSNIFRVINLNERGHEHLPCKIELTPSELLLYQGRNLSCSWPIRTLRRYGFHNNIFSFESGRRCTTGEGFFAFQSDQAEQIFQLLQSNIRRSCNNMQLMAGISQNGSYLEPRSISSRHESVGSQNSAPQTPLSPQLPFTSALDFEMRDVSDKDSGTVVNRSAASNSPCYANVSTNDDKNLGTDTPHNPYTMLLTDAQSSRKLQYLDLDLNNKQSLPVTKSLNSENGPSTKYTPIDFQKTHALHESTKPNAENDRECKRRTRHNSTLHDQSIRR